VKGQVPLPHIRIIQKASRGLHFANPGMLSEGRFMILCLLPDYCRTQTDISPTPRFAQA
jgi:hypothetical protein